MDVLKTFSGPGVFISDVHWVGGGGKGEGGQASNTFPLRITCKRGGGGGRGVRIALLRR